MSDIIKTNIVGQYTEMVQDVKDASTTDIISENYNLRQQTDLDSQERGEFSAVVHQIEDSVDPESSIPYKIFCTPHSTHEGIDRISQMCQAKPAIWLYDESRPTVGSVIKIRFDNIKDRNSATYIGPEDGLGSLYSKIDITSIATTSFEAVKMDVAQSLNGLLSSFGETDVPNRTLQVANSIRDRQGGHYSLNGKQAKAGIIKRIVHKNKTWEPSGFVYCSGYTFNVVMDTAESLGLLENITENQIATFYKNWYGYGIDRERQQGPAMSSIGIGGLVSNSDAKPGDFCQFWRKNGLGHSTVFKGWITDDSGQKIGLEYRSAQTSTKGVGDKKEFFVSKGGSVIPNRIYFSRLKSS